MAVLTDRDRKFWSDPPWAGGARTMRMGIRRTSFDHWLPDIEPDHLQWKLATWRNHEAQVYSVVEGFEATAATCVRHCQQLRRGAMASAPKAGWPPLVALALETQDDICLLAPVPAPASDSAADTHMLAAACLMAPSYWRLGDKLGRTILDIHAPVPSLSNKIGAVMDRFLNRLTPGDLFERRNWFIHQSDALFQPLPERWDGQNDELVLRSERQTLTKLVNNVVVFTIAVHCYPLAQIQQFPDAAQDMLAAFKAMDTDEKEHFGFAGKADQILRIVEAG